MTQYSGAKINIIFELPKIFSKKYRFWPKILDSVGKKRGKILAIQEKQIKPLRSD